MDDERLKPKQEPAIHTIFKTELKPYRLINGDPTFSASELTCMFERAKDERLFPLVMYNVDPGTPVAAFLRMYRIGTGRLLWLVFYGGEPAGWVWLDDVANRTARCHFCLFRWVSKDRLSEQVGREMFWRLFGIKFRNGVTLQVLRAEMPGFNKPGLWFLESVGLKRIGEIPDAAYRFSTDKFYPMIYLYATKDMVRRTFQRAASIVSPKDEASRVLRPGFGSQQAVEAG